MAFVLQTDEETSAGLRRVTSEQLRGAIAGFSDERLPRDEAVHRARQRCKKIRALLRLLGNTHAPWIASENANIRDAANGLAHIRDADAVLETFDEFRHRAAKRVSRCLLKEVRKVLIERRLLASQTATANAPIEDFTIHMTTVLDRVNSLTFQVNGLAELMPGFSRTHQRGRRAMKECSRSSSDEAYHDWRKWSKFELYQLQLLGPYCKKKSLKHKIGGFKRLSNLLGIDHDLTVLRHELVEATDFSLVRKLAHFGALLQAIDERRIQLHRRAVKTGKRLYCKNTQRQLRLTS